MSNSRQLLICLTLFGLALRGLVPVGFMPNVGDVGGTPIVICSAGLYRTIFVDQDGNQTTTEHQPGETQAACPYGLLLDDPALPGVAAIAFNSTPRLHKSAAFLARSNLARQRAKAHPPRAPPLFS